MQSEDRTFIIIEPDVGIQASDFLAEWNAQAAVEDQPIAAIKERAATFDASLLKVLGDAANCIAIATFIGLPTISSMVSKLLSKRSMRQSALPPRSEPPPSAAATPAPLAVDETIVDLGPNGRVKKIVVRRCS